MGEAATDDDPLRGTPYETLGLLGEGGMGTVLEAVHRRLEKVVAIKVLRPGVASEQAIRRLVREGEALAKLAHPNLIAVTDLGETADQLPYLVMERLHGVTLADEIRKRKRLPVREALRVVEGLLAALDAAHAHGIVHRDVKPSNVFLCDALAGQPRVVKLLDFGVVKWDPKEGAQPLTAEGAVIGTPRFLSPEQSCGGRVDARTDVYAAGLVLYLMLCGRGPFDEARDFLSVLSAHMSEIPVPPSQHAAGVAIPRELDAAVLRALAKIPDERFGSAAAFATALAAIADAIEKEQWLPTERMDPAELAPAPAPAVPDDEAKTQERPRASPKTAPMPAMTPRGTFLLAGGSTPVAAPVAPAASPAPPPAAAAVAVAAPLVPPNAASASSTRQWRTIALAAMALVCVLVAVVVYLGTR